MKFFILSIFLAISFGSFCSFSLFYIAHVFNKKITIPKNSIAQELIIESTIPGLPTRLIIPKINVNANIQELGVNSNGDMDVPNNITDVGWFKLGSRPGEKGSAVIAGHLDGKNSKGVFANLNKLKEGDQLHIQDNNGKLFVFIIRESRIYDPGYAEEIFNSNDSAHLNLITCDGVWDKNKKSYSKRLVVFADLKNNI